MDRVVVGSCHGLICLALQNGTDFYLWNPSTGHHNNLPDPSCVLLNKQQLLSIVDFDIQFAFGFGYDSSSDDYKVFFGIKVIHGYTTDSEEKVAIFSTRENCWRIIEQYPPKTPLLSHPYARYRCGSFVDGTLNWLVQEKRDSSRMYKLVDFDLKTERYFELPMLDKDASYVYVGLGNLAGRLCLSIADTDQSFSFKVVKPHLVDLWVMNDYGGEKSWARLLNAPFLSKCPVHFPLCLSKNNQIILTKGADILTRVDVEGRKLHECKIANRFITSCEAVAYMETLVWPCHVEEQKS